MTTYRRIFAFFAGFIFALGLGISGMTLPAKVLGFLDIFSLTDAWDPTLMFVLFSAVGTYALLFRYTAGLARPILGGDWRIPTRSDITPRLLIGAVLFGIGWGLSGFCPGPVLASIATGSASVLVFVTTMTAGMGLSKLFE